MPATTSGYRRIEAGAILTFNDGTTTWTFTSVERGTLEWEHGGYKPLPFTERGILQTPYEGDERQGKLSLKVKYAGAQATDDVGKFLQTRDTTTGKMKMWTIVLKNPTVKGGATGEQITFPTAYLAEGGLKFKAGTEYDMLEIEMVLNGPTATPTTY